MTQPLSVTIAKMQAEQPYRSYSSIMSELGKRSAVVRRKKRERAAVSRPNLYWYNKD